MKFSIKQLMGSTAFVAAGIWMTIQMARGVRDSDDSRYILLLLAIVPSFFAAFYNLSARPWRGAKIGLIVVVIAVLAVALVWLMLRRF
jgi:hypothetical protein